MHIFIKELVLELHLLVVVFGTNLASNISTKITPLPNVPFLVQIRWKFKTHFGMEIISIQLIDKKIPFKIYGLIYLSLLDKIT